ncbi:nucleotide exchange factor GrpE [Candidatus Falkowbacteria bacterium]|nr:nucleotide exchange factor GrpE [Candidatus Falkowbacteria bacterium]
METKKHDKEETKKRHDHKRCEPCETELNELEHRYKTALADYQNLLKQTAKDKHEFAKYANEQLIHEFLPVYDHLKLSLAHIDAAAEKSNWLVGVQYVIKQFQEVLAKHGVTEIKTIGEKFDHNLMEAVGTEPAETDEQDDVVAKEIKAGYLLHGKVITPARVVIYEKAVQE